MKKKYFSNLNMKKRYLRSRSLQKKVLNHNVGQGKISIRRVKILASACSTLSQRTLKNPLILFFVPILQTVDSSIKKKEMTHIHNLKDLSVKKK